MKRPHRTFVVLHCPCVKQAVPVSRRFPCLQRFIGFYIFVLFLFFCCSSPVVILTVSQTGIRFCAFSYVNVVVDIVN